MIGGARSTVWLVSFATRAIRPHILPNPHNPNRRTIGRPNWWTLWLVPDLGATYKKERSDSSEGYHKMYEMWLLLASSTVGEIPPIAPATSLPDLQRTERDVVLRWNETALKAIRTDRTPPPLAARNLAILHATICDAVNGVTRTHQSFRVSINAPPDASLDVAAAIAGHRVLVALYPRQIPCFDRALDQSLVEIADGDAKTKGMQLGQAVAENILDWRRRDGADHRTTYKHRIAAGRWRPTPPDFRAALLPQWPTVTCFCMKNSSQFRSPPPPALSSDEYAASFREVKRLGGVRSAARTPEQTEIARFWADDEGTVTPPGHWNRIAQTVATDRGLTLAENARLFALLNLALADAGIASWDCKFAFNVWRPIDGIAEADPGVHADTTPDRNWSPLLTTPPFPSYTSGHSSFSGAAAAVLADFCGTDAVRFTSSSESLPGVKRTFARFSIAAEEAGKSRVYGGIHWEFDNRAGLDAGRTLGEYVCRSFLRPRATTVGTTSGAQIAP